MICPPAQPTLPQTLFWLAAVATFLLTGFAALVAVWRYNRELKAKAWDRAHRAYERFLDQALANPEFHPRYWTEQAMADPTKRNKYRWFMARFLWAAEQVLETVPEARDQWARVVWVMLREHADFLSAPEAQDEVDCYYGLLGRLIRKAKALENPTPANGPQEP